MADVSSPPASGASPAAFATIDDVIAQLDVIIATARRRGSADGYFAALYRRVTATVKTRIAQGAFEAAVGYSKERKAFGKPISNLQAIQFKLADMATKIAAARSLVHRAASTKDRHERYVKEAAMAKLYASKVAVEVALEAIQVHGGYGYVREYKVERYLRDAKITEIYEGTSEIQHIVIARELAKESA